jgi:hypothetical protein
MSISDTLTQWLKDDDILFFSFGKSPDGSIAQCEQTVMTGAGKTMINVKHQVQGTSVVDMIGTLKEQIAYCRSCRSTIVGVDTAFTPKIK